MKLGNPRFYGYIGGALTIGGVLFLIKKKWKAKKK